MDENYTLYIHCNKITNKSYIGVTGRSPKERWANGSHYIDSPYFYRAIKKYGWDNFEHIIFMNHLTKENANLWERRLILLFKTYDRNTGYNIGLGGNCVGCHSEETKQKIKDNHADFKGINHPQYGKKLSEETKRRISEAHKGKVYSKERCQEISVRTKGANNPRAKTVRCINNGMIFTTAKEAGEWCGRDFSGICKCCNKKQHTCGIDILTGEKLKWEYLS